MICHKDEDYEKICAGVKKTKSISHLFYNFINNTFDKTIISPGLDCCQQIRQLEGSDVMEMVAAA